MLVIAVRLDLEADALDAFRTLILNSARQSLANEPGCKRYEASFSEDGTACFVYEVYEDRDAFEAHLNTDHFAEFDRKAKGLIAGTRVEEYLLDAASA